MGSNTTTQNVITQTQLPSWYSDYLQQVMGRAVGAAGEPFQQYTGPLNAGLTADQQQAYNIVRGSANGAASPWLQAGTDLYNQSADASSGAAGQGAFDQASGLFTGAAGANTAGISQPYVQQGAGLAGIAGQGSSLAAANPYIQQSTSPTGLQAASPFLGAASQTFPGAVQDYMSPYTQQVTDRIAQLGERNLKENLLPSISDQFVRAGQFGSAQQRDVVGRALRDTNESVLGQQAQALEQGYGTAGQLFNQDQSRLAGLAGTAGGLGTSQQQILQGAGNTLGGLSGSDLSRQLSAGQTIGQLGLGQSSAASADASRQLQAGQGLSNIGQSQIQASQADLQRQLAAAQGLAAIGQQGQNMTLQNAAALQSVGAEQQQTAQQGINTAYGQFQQQQSYPWQQIGNLSNVIQGLPVNTSSSTQASTTQPAPSGLSQVAGVGLGVAGLANSGIFHAKGGAVRAGKVVKYKKTHSYGNTPRRGIAVFEDAA